jgi:integrase/recombinase XerD
MEQIKLHQFAEKMDMAGYAKRTVQDYVAAMRLFVRYLDDKEDVKGWEDITAEHIRAYQAYIQFGKSNKGRQLSGKTVAGRLGAIKMFFRIMYREKLLPADAGESIRLPIVRKHLPRHVPSLEDTLRLLKAAEPVNTLAIRDRAMLELLYATGIRSEELRNITIDDYDTAENRLFIRGKGAKDRIVPVGAWVTPYIEAYLEKSRICLVKPHKPTSLMFVTNHGNKLARNELWYIVHKYSAKAGISPVMPHAIRHACATHLLHNGADIRIVQELLGHSSLASTQIYTRVDITQLHRAHARFHPREQA